MNSKKDSWTAMERYRYQSGWSKGFLVAHSYWAVIIVTIFTILVITGEIPMNK